MENFSISNSGLSVSQFRMGRVGHDLANVNTKGFSQGQVHQVEDAQGGTRISNVKKVPNNNPLQYSNTDIAEEFSEMTISSGSYKANLQVIKSKDEMLGDLLDTIG